MIARNLWRLGAIVSVGMLSCGANGSRAFGAAWDSIRGNNRSAGSIHETRRPSPPIPDHRAAEKSRAVIEPRSDHRGREIEAQRREAFERESREHRHLDIDGDRRHLYFWSGYAPGFVAGALPSGYAPVYVGGTPYFYYQGVYYQNSPSGYVVVAPPIGATVAELPPGAEAVPVGNMLYYYAGGAFYVQQPQGGFIVVSPPIGAVVDSLPDGAAQATINGVPYFQAEGAYFLPEMRDGVTVYQAVRPPGY